MSLFRKIFGLRNTPEDHIKSEERGKYMPEIKLPIDERFTINFKANGGKFLYCENMEEIYKSFKNILEENNWERSEEHTSELQSRENLVCRLLLEKKKNTKTEATIYPVKHDRA